MLTDHRQVRLVGSEEWTGTLSEFFAANEEFDLADCLDIQSALNRNGYAEGGGGAAATWRLEIVRKPLCPTCSSRGWISTHQDTAPLWALSSGEHRARIEAELAAPRIRCPQGCEPRAYDLPRLATDAQRLALAVAA